MSSAKQQPFCSGLCVLTYNLLNRGPFILNSLAPGGFDYSLKLVNFKLILKINILSIFCEIGIRWLPQPLTYH